MQKKKNTLNFPNNKQAFLHFPQKKHSPPLLSLKKASIPNKKNIHFRLPRKKIKYLLSFYQKFSCFFYL